MQQRPGVPLSPGHSEGPRDVDGGSSACNAINSVRTMSSSGLRPRAAAPVALNAATAAAAAAAGAADIRQGSGLPPPSAATAHMKPQGALDVETRANRLHQYAAAHLSHAEGMQQYDNAATQGTSITPPFGYPDAVAASLHARAAELCRRPEVYAQLFLMLRSSQGQLAAACLRQLPPQNYIGIRDATGHTLLHWAALCNEREVMQILLTAGADVNARATESQQTPLMWAVTKDNASAGRLLLEHGAAVYEQQLKPNASGVFMDSDKQQQQQQQQPHQLRDYDPQRQGQLSLMQDSKGGTCCTLAAQHNSPKCILLLFRLLGPKAFTVPDASGCTPAHWAAYKGHSLVLRLLLYLEVDVTAVDLFGCLPLHRAAEGGHLEAFRALVEEGGLDPNERTTKTRMTSLDMLSSNKTANPELINYLKLHQQNPSLREGPRHRILTEDDLKPPPSCRPSLMFRLFTDCSGGLRLKLPPFLALLGLALMLVVYARSFDPLYLPATPATISAVGAAAGAWSGGWFAWFCVLGKIGVYTSLLLIIVLICSDPGILAKRPKGDSSVEELMDLLAAAETPPETIDEIDMQRLCYSCWIYKPIRTKHCRVCDRCIEGFDHHCPWIANCVGYGNARCLTAWLLCVCFTQALHFYLCCWCYVLHIKVEGFLQGSLALFSHDPFLAVAMHTLPFVILRSYPFLWAHIRNVANNITMNELLNRGRYKYLWKRAGVMTRHGMRWQKTFNPLSKGAWNNCWDFWLGRRRLLHAEELPFVRINSNINSNMSSRPCMRFSKKIFSFIFSAHATATAPTSPKRSPENVSIELTRMQPEARKQA